MSRFGIEDARSILGAAARIGAEKGLVGLTVVVTDAGGAIRAAERNDAAGRFGVEIAVAKARTALGFGRSSLKSAAVFGEKPAAVAGLSGATSGAFLPIGGGVVIVDAKGDVCAAAAVAGGAPDVDHAVAAAAVAAAGWAVLD
jgi:uncharacterized protein GlcG (DUF336 family)